MPPERSPAVSSPVKKKKSTTRPKGKAAGRAKPKLLSGGNPQIAMGDGDKPVKAYIAAMPGWKRDVGRQLDGLIVRAVPGVHKAVKWNSPFYGVADRGWFVSVHCFANFVRLTFFSGTSLTPPPPGPSKVKNVRYLDLREGEEVATPQIKKWIKEAASLPGWNV